MSDKKPRTEIRRVSKKRAAENEAKGVRQFSTIVPKAPAKKAKKAKPVGRGAMMQRRSPIAKVGKQKAKREARNKAYYASAEWRAKRKAVFERDGYQCVERFKEPTTFAQMATAPEIRCPNRGEIVNHKQTSRGLVAEEKSYGHRGVEGAIARIVTRCKDCDRRLTPLERINHAHGFRSTQ